jgi:hypothetical protein
MYWNWKSSFILKYISLSTVQYQFIGSTGVQKTHGHWTVTGGINNNIGCKQLRVLHGPILLVGWSSTSGLIGGWDCCAPLTSLHCQAKKLRWTLLSLSNGLNVCEERKGIISLIINPTTTRFDRKTKSSTRSGGIRQTHGLDCWRGSWVEGRQWWRQRGWWVDCRQQEQPVTARPRRQWLRSLALVQKGQFIMVALEPPIPLKSH